MVRSSNCNCLVLFIILRRQASVFVSIEQLLVLLIFEITVYIIIQMINKSHVARYVGLMSTRESYTSNGGESLG